jgi:hypothetical protein
MISGKKVKSGKNFNEKIFYKSRKVPANKKLKNFQEKRKSGKNPGKICGKKKIYEKS